MWYCTPCQYQNGLVTWQQTLTCHTVSARFFRPNDDPGKGVAAISGGDRDEKCWCEAHIITFLNLIWSMNWRERQEGVEVTFAYYSSMRDKHPAVQWKTWCRVSTRGANLPNNSAAPIQPPILQPPKSSVALASIYMSWASESSLLSPLWDTAVEVRRTDQTWQPQIPSCILSIQDAILGLPSSVPGWKFALRDIHHIFPPLPLAFLHLPGRSHWTL